MPPARTIYALTAVIAVAYALIAGRAGIRVSPDTTTFSGWADLLIAHGFNIPTYLNEQTFVVPPVLYLGWILVVAAFKSVLGDGWMAGIVLLNCGALVVGAYLTLQAVRRITQSSASLLLAGALFLVAADLMIFVPFVLSDLIFWGLSTCVLTIGVALASAGADQSRPRAMRTVAAGTFITVIALAFRPAALPLVTFWIAAVTLRFAPNIKGRGLQVLLGTAAALSLIAIAIHAAVLMDPSLWPFGPLPGMLQLLAGEYRAGILVYAPGASLAVAPASDWMSAMRLTIEKLTYFLSPWQPDYSAAHTIVNLLFFAPAYGLTLAALLNARRLFSPQQRAAAVLLLFSLAVSVFHAMMQIEYDHRYRLPILPALIMLAAIGLESVRRPRTLASIARAK